MQHIENTNEQAADTNKQEVFVTEVFPGIPGNGKKGEQDADSEKLSYYMEQ